MAGGVKGGCRWHLRHKHYRRDRSARTCISCRVRIVYTDTCISCRVRVLTGGSKRDVCATTVNSHCTAGVIKYQFGVLSSASRLGANRRFLAPRDSRDSRFEQPCPPSSLIHTRYEAPRPLGPAKGRDAGGVPRGDGCVALGVSGGEVTAAGPAAGRPRARHARHACARRAGNC